MYMTSKGQERKRDYFYESKGQANKQGLKPSIKDIEVSLILFLKDKRIKDIDGSVKLILDSLQGVLYENDNQIIKLTIEKKYDAKNPRAEVEFAIL